MGINTEPPGASITSAWIAADGHYAFVEFRTPEEANNGFNLNNVAIHGQVKIFLTIIYYRYSFFLIAAQTRKAKNLCRSSSNNIESRTGWIM